MKMMMKGAYIINLSRGDVINEDDLYAMLVNNHLAGVALDVFEKEPYTGPLTNLENVILTPHIGTYTKETRAEMEMLSATNLLNFLDNSK